MIPLDILQKFEGPPAWGVNDCVQFACGVREYYTGQNPAVESGLRYSTEAEAANIVHDAGSMEALVSKYLGPAVGPEYATRAVDGDIAMAFGRGVGPIIGVVCGYRFLVRAERGFVPIKLDKVLRFWPCHSSSR